MPSEDQEMAEALKLMIGRGSTLYALPDIELADLQDIPNIGYLPSILRRLAPSLPESGNQAPNINELVQLENGSMVRVRLDAPTENDLIQKADLEDLSAFFADAVALIAHTYSQGLEKDLCFKVDLDKYVNETEEIAIQSIREAKSELFKRVYNSVVTITRYYKDTDQPLLESRIKIFTELSTDYDNLGPRVIKAHLHSEIYNELKKQAGILGQ